jgi:GNAT superfamily N-acetyltransferase
MESTELQLRDEHLAGCLALSKSANWNQNEADWRLMLGFGRGWGVMLADGTLAATTVVLPYGSFAWVSMVLVLPEHRGKGHATRLLRVALTDLKNRALTPILDATPAGHEVYVQEGFRDTWSFKRFALDLPAKGLSSSAKVREITNADWAGVLRLDASAFGARRECVLRDLAARLPQAALLAETDGEIAGFVLGRDGREARQLGPLVARNAQAATDLLDAAMNRVEIPVYIDIADHAPSLQSRAQQRGFEIQRPFTRMVHGERHAPGETALVFCPAGPELG